MKKLTLLVIAGVVISCGKPPTQQEANNIANKRLNEFLKERYAVDFKRANPILKTTIFNNNIWSFNYTIELNSKRIEVVVMVNDRRIPEISLEEFSRN